MSELEKILFDQKNCFVIDNTIPYSDYVPLDLSPESKLLEIHKPKTAADYELLLLTFFAEKKAKVAYGGYLEKRNLYQRSTVFNDSVQLERNIHIGLDLWIKAGTQVLAALDGKIHSFQNNTNLGDYGPTIIIEHSLNNCQFYTLYGHLSLESIESLKIGQLISKGEQIATLGEASVNGDYAAHLHFQIIQNLEGKSGDYSGVCSEQHLSFYRQNCPNPNLLLKI
jgi:murein DD-endopeptidase MepM/ murein hydrolase activator NlpD